MNKLILIISLLFISSTAHAELVRKMIEYKQGDATLEGYLVYNPDIKPGTAAGVLVVHEWMGLNDYAKSRADQLADLGYVAFAADIYGKGIRPTTVEAAGAEAGKYKGNRSLFRERVLAGLDQLKKQPLVNPNKIAAIGYCFGGTAVIELARSGTDIQGIVSFHGGLSAGDIADQPIKTKMLILHGDSDPFVPPTEVAAFENEMKANKADYSLIKYPGAMHGFTNPNNKGTLPGALYNQAADAKSWEAMTAFFKAIGL